MKRYVCLPVQKDDSTIPRLPRALVRISQPEPCTAEANLTVKDGEDNFQGLENAFTPIKVVAQLRQAIRQEMISNCFY